MIPSFDIRAMHSRQKNNLRVQKFRSFLSSSEVFSKTERDDNLFRRDAFKIAISELDEFDFDFDQEMDDNIDNIVMDDIKKIVSKVSASHIHNALVENGWKWYSELEDENRQTSIYSKLFSKYDAWLEVDGKELK